MCCLLQVFDNKTTYIFDFVAASKGKNKASNIMAMVNALKAVLEDAAVAKVVHDGRQVRQQTDIWLTRCVKWSDSENVLEYV